MVEVVVMLPVMILLWAGVDYFRAAYSRKMDSLMRAEMTAWKQAYSNDGSCFANKEPWSGFTGELSVASVGDDGATISDATKGSTTNSLFIYAHANVQVEQSTLAPRWGSGTAVMVRGGSYMACNEVVPASDKDQDVLTPLWDFVKSIFKT